jgi:hypothetical protein
MHLQKLSIGLILILLSLSTVFNYAMVMAVTPPTIQVSVEDLNGDGLKDIKFTAMKEGLGSPRVRVSVSAGVPSGLTLFEGETDHSGSCLFYDVPGRTYRWVASDGVPPGGEIIIPTSEFCLTESEAVAWQTIAMNWMGESGDAGRALFEKMSKFVGFDPTGNPFSALIGSTLLEYSQRTYQWLDKLQSYIVNLDRPELNLLNKMIFPFKAVSAGFFDDGANGVDFSRIANVTLQLVLNSTEQIVTYAFAGLHSDGNIAGSLHEILRMPVKSGLDMTLAFPTEMIVAAFQHCYEPRFLNPSTLWDSSIRSTDESFPTRCISILNMTASAISEALNYLGYARTAVDSLKVFFAVGPVASLLGGLVAAVQVFYGVVVTIMTVFHWWETYPNVGLFLSNILQGNPVLLTEVAMVAFNVLLVVYGAYYLYSLLTSIVLGAVYTGIGILLGIIGWVLWWWYQRVVYNQEIDVLEGDLGGNLTALFRVRQGLRDMNVTSLRQTAGVYQRSADVLSRFAMVARERSSSSGLEHFFGDSAATLKAHAEEETELANAVGNATVSLDNLLHDYLSWNGKSGQITAYLDGYNSTKVTYSHSGETFTNSAVVGTKDCSTYIYDKKHITADNLGGSLSSVSRGNISREERVWWWTEWHGWAWDYLPKEKDSHGNEIAVFYDVGKANPIQYDRKPDYLNVSYAHATTTFETFYQYKFQFERHPEQDILAEWTEHMNQASKQFGSDYRRLQYALDAPVFEENATGKPQFGNSWSSVSDPSSTSGQVMMAPVNSSNGGCLFGPYIDSTSSGESMLGMPYCASFRLKVSSNVSASVVAVLDVAYDAGVVLQSKQVRASDFLSPGNWQDFSLRFTAPKIMSAKLEFRVRNSNNGIANVLFDKVSITRGENVSTLYYEAAYNKPKSDAGPWSVVNDPSSLSGKVMMASSSSPSNGWLFGPYINQSFDANSLLGKACIATFRLKVSSNQYAGSGARIDVVYNAGSVLQWAQVKANDFASSNTWQDFKLTFVVPNSLTSGLEFRVQNLNSGHFTDIFVDEINVLPWGDSSVVFTEGAINKQRRQGDTSWQNVSDNSSFSGLVMKANSSTQNGNFLYGPYAMSGSNGESMLGKPYVVTFRSKVSSNLSPNTVAYFDVAYNAGTILQSMTIKASDFSASDVWQNFQLTFVVPNSLTYGLEFRVQNWNNHVTDFLVDTITVVQGWSSSDVYVEAAYNKQQTGSWQFTPPYYCYYNSSWSRVLDSSSTSGVVMKASNASGRSDCLYGPYIMSDWNGQSMLGKPYTATFRLKVSNKTSDRRVVYIDVGYNAWQTLQSRLIKANDFISANTWQDFKLTFIVPSSLTCGLEFRIVSFNTNVTDVYADKITVDPEWNASTTYLESAYNKFQSGNSWSKLSDPSSSSGLVMKASRDSTNGGCLFGPYTYVGWDHESMLGRAYVATFRLKVSSNLAGSDVVSIDVACNTGFVLQSVRIKATDFASSDAWQDFRLTFVVPSSLTYGLEFRITNLNHGTTDIFADCVSITQT